MKLTKKQTAVIHSMLTTLLRSGLIEIVFEKANGSIRVVQASQETKILKEHGIDEDSKVSQPATSFDTIKFVDDNIGEWRSARLDTIISINGLKIETLAEIVK